MRGAAELAQLFDRSFSEPAHAAAPTEAFLAVAAGGVPYVIPLRQVRGLLGGRAVVAVPSPAPALLGIASTGSAILPVYDLARLLGGAPDAEGTCRWLLLVDAPAPAALAFGRFDGHLELPAAGPHAGRATLQIGGHSRTLIDLDVLAAAIGRQTHTEESR